MVVLCNLHAIWTYLCSTVSRILRLILIYLIYASLTPMAIFAWVIILLSFPLYLSRTQGSLILLSFPFPNTCQEPKVQLYYCPFPSFPQYLSTQYLSRTQGSCSFLFNIQGSGEGGVHIVEYNPTCLRVRVECTCQRAMAPKVEKKVFKKSLDVSNLAS